MAPKRHKKEWGAIKGQKGTCKGTQLDMSKKKKKKEIII